jgi:hypothetical protein
MCESNRFIRGCIDKQFESGFDEGHTIPLGYNNEPSCRNGYTIINPHIYESKYSKDFIKRDNQYTAPDPRLYDPLRNSGMWLDRPPINGHVNMDDVYNESLEEYGKKYSSYSDINTGQIMYYNDELIEDPYFHPVFERGATVTAKLYRDPMGGIQPIYDWKPSPINTCVPFTQKPLSFIEDSQFYRQDIMATQMRSTNRSRYAPRWSAQWKVCDT